MKVNIYKLLLAVFAFGGAAVSCTEDIDMSNRYTFTGETVTDYIANHEEFSEYYRLIKKVPLSEFSNSSVAQLLSARGNFEVFLPTNEAIRTYLGDSVGAKKGLIPDTTTTTLYLEDEHLADSLDRIIVYNSIINRGDNYSTFWYVNEMCRTAQLQTANMNGRYLSVSEPIWVADSTGVRHEVCTVKSGAYVWNIANRDVEVFNGVIQIMDGVVAPSNENIFQVLLEDERFVTFSNLMSLTGIASELTDPNTAFEDYEYKNMYEAGAANFSGARDEGGYYTQLGVGTEGSRSILPESRKYGFTIFAETDDVMAAIGVNGTDNESMANLVAYLQSQGCTGNADNDYSNPDNIVRQWINYHILPMKLSKDQLVVHWNEQEYKPNISKAATMPIAEYYQTYGTPYRVLKISEGCEQESGDFPTGIRLNCFWRNNPTARSRSTFVSETYLKGVLVNTDENLEPLNGIVYPIDEILTFNDNVINRMGNERIRFDIASLLPEMMNNNLRRLTGEYAHGRNMAFSVKNSKNIQYFDRFVSNNEESRINYLPGVGSNWLNMQGDEFNVEGSYDLTIQIPPVAKGGTYELRYGVSANSNRTMCQVYFGSNKNALPAVGIPMDLRTGGKNRWVGGNPLSNIGWDSDSEDEAANQEVDKKMRNNGYMKGPATYLRAPATEFNVKNSLREQDPNALRCILTTANLKAGELYYVRFKDVLGNDKGQFFFDYMELCPKSVYGNPNNPEDKW